ncbi:MAG: DNA recombination protein RmuC [Erysipelotrichaceae bacterium]|nr:DNA recombination protein RmuC [Erysipelotrichaceae bacterium]
MEYIIIILLLIIIALQIYFNLNKKQTQQLNKTIQNNIQTISHTQKEIGQLQNQNLMQIAQVMNTSLNQLEMRIQTLELTNEQKLDTIRLTFEKRLNYMQTTQNERLDQIQETVDDKLQQTLEKNFNQSFKLVSERLEAVYKGLGEMRTLASGVDDLKKVLSNVKTRGILGEVQLGAILEDILTPDQYETNFAPIKNSKNVVEYAVKLPRDNGQYVYLPIDSKFPSDAYIQLQNAYEASNQEEIQIAVNQLILRIKGFAKEIRNKYIEPPYTTDFAIMFIPFEGLYAEIINRGLVETLQHDYHINIAGPSTMAALLNSLQMGFKTLALQRRSSEVWELLGMVKSEFDKFDDILSLTQQRLEQANKELDKLVGVRTRAIKRKLRDVEKIENNSFLDE